MKENEIVYVIKYKYDCNKKLIYYIEEMIYTATRGNYIYCRKLEFKNNHYYTPYIYATTFSKQSNRVFSTFEEADKIRKIKQKEYDLKKQIELEFKKRIKEEDYEIN